MKRIEDEREPGEHFLGIVLCSVSRLRNNEGTLSAIADAAGSCGEGEHASQTRM